MVLAARAHHSIPTRTNRARAWIAVARVAITLAPIAALLSVATPAHAQPTRVVSDPVLGEASRALAAGDTDRAFLLGRGYLKRHPPDQRAHVLLLRVHLEREERDSAYRTATRAPRAH